MADEVRDEPGRGPVIEGVGVVPLVQLPFVHHADGIADRKSFELVMGHEQRCGLRRLQDGAHFVRQALAQVHVEVGKRLVQQQQARLGRQRSGQRHALLLATGEFMRIAPLGAGEPHQIQHFGHARGALRAGQAVDAEADVLPHIQVRKQRVVLEHHADAPQLGCERAARAADHLATEADLAGTHRLQPGNGAQQGGLAAAGRADQHADLAGPQAERRPADCGLRPTGVVHIELANFQEHEKHCR
jgi:hypothetical protein